MASTSAGKVNRQQRWGTASALSDDEEARRRLIEAATRCIARNGTAKVRIEEVAAEAGVSRMTVYRYFSSRDDVILAVLLNRIDSGMAGVVRSLRSPQDAARSLPDLVLNSIGLVSGDEVNEALFSPDSRSFVAALEFASEPIIDAFHHHIGPLLQEWQTQGQLYADLDLRETTRYVNAVSMMLMTPPWLELSRRAKRSYLDRYLVRALVQRPA